LNPGLVLSESLKNGQTLGGTVVAVGGFVPIFASRRDKISALRFLLAQYEQQRGAEPNSDEIKKLDLYFDQYFGKVLGG
jgi:hypothetical protein